MWPHRPSQDDRDRARAHSACCQCGVMAGEQCKHPTNRNMRQSVPDHAVRVDMWIASQAPDATENEALTILRGIGWFIASGVVFRRNRPAIPTVVAYTVREDGAWVPMGDRIHLSMMERAVRCGWAYPRTNGRTEFHFTERAREALTRYHHQAPAGGWSRNVRPTTDQADGIGNGRTVNLRPHCSQVHSEHQGRRKRGGFYVS